MELKKVVLIGALVLFGAWNLVAIAWVISKVETQNDIATMQFMVDHGIKGFHKD